MNHDPGVCPVEFLDKEGTNARAQGFSLPDQYLGFQLALNAGGVEGLVWKTVYL